MTEADSPTGRRLSRRHALVETGIVGGATLGAVGWLGFGSTPAAPPVVIGGTLPLSGAQAGIGGPLQRGLILWAEQMTAAGGLVGRPVRVELTDDAGDPGQARRHFETQVAGWDLAVAPYGSPGTEAVIDLVEAASIPCVAPTAGDRSLWTAGRDWTVQLLNPVDTFLRPAVDVAASAGASSLGVIHRRDPFTPTTMAGAEQRARALGWTVQEPVQYTTEDQLPERMADVLADAPDVVLGSGFRPGAAGGGFLPDALALSDVYERAGGGADFVCWSIGATFPAFAEARGVAAADATGVTGWKPYVDFPGNAAFQAAYAARWDEQPDSHAVQGYATGEVLAEAVSDAGDLEPGSVRDALFALETETVFGRYRVTQRGLQVGKTNVVVQWQDGAPVVVAPDRWADGALRYPMTDR